MHITLDLSMWSLLKITELSTELYVETEVLSRCILHTIDYSEVSMTIHRSISFSYTIVDWSTLVKIVHGVKKWKKKINSCLVCWITPMKRSLPVFCDLMINVIEEPCNRCCNLSHFLITANNYDQRGKKSIKVRETSIDLIYMKWHTFGHINHSYAVWFIGINKEIFAITFLFYCSQTTLKQFQNTNISL